MRSIQHKIYDNSIDLIMPTYLPIQVLKLCIESMYGNSIVGWGHL